MQTLGIIGFGSFGRFAAQHLSRHFAVTVADRRPPEDAGDVGVVAASVQEAARCEVVVLAVPVQNLAQLVTTISDQLTENTLLLEVASVKERPARILDHGLPPGIRFLGLHPMFGPQSGRDGIQGLKVVACSPEDERALPRERQLCVLDFLESLGLEVLTMSAADHDREMAYIQGLPHWIAKALREIHLPDTALATPAYRHLLQIEEILREDSLDLFLTIQRENSYAGPARAELRRRLEEIETMVENR